MVSQFGNDLAVLVLSRIVGLARRAALFETQFEWKERVAAIR